jgi:hypothetical protein
MDNFLFDLASGACEKAEPTNTAKEHTSSSDFRNILNFIYSYLLQK